MRGAIGSRSGALGDILREPTSPNSATNVADQLMAMIRSLMPATPTTNIRAVGIGAAGVFNGDAAMQMAPNMRGLDRGSLRSAIESEFELPVVFDNDVNVAALGELRHGIGRRYLNFAVIAVGTGIGMGLVLEGKLVRGASGAAGEIGYLPLGCNPFDAATFTRGALEEMVAGDAIASRVPGALTAKEVFALGVNHHPAAVASLRTTYRHIALAIAAVEAIANPAHYVLTGGVGGQSETLAGVRTELAQLGRTLAIEISQLGDQAGILGAIELATSTIPLTREETPWINR